MISSFFGKTKPINYVVILIFMGLFYWTLHFFWNAQTLSPERIWTKVLALSALLLSIVFVNEIIRQNKVTSLNSFAMLFFVVLTVVFSTTIFDDNAVFANFFILLAIKKLLEVKKANNAKHQILDATLLICVATLFYKWAFIYFAAVAFAINTYESRNFKSWLAFIVGVAIFFLLTWTILLSFGGENFLLAQYDFTLPEWGNQAFYKKLSIKNGVFLVLIVLFAVFDFIKLRKKGGGRLVMMRNMLLCFALAYFLILFESNEASPILLSFFPAAVFLTNFVETIQKKRFKELVVSLFIVGAFLVFFFEKLV